MKVFVGFTGTASTASDFLSVITAASNPRRFKLYDILIGSSATPADNAFLWQIRKKTGAPTTPGTVDGPSVLDISDTIASTLVGGSLPATNGAGTSLLMELGLNQRASFRWVAAPLGELVSPATASNGFATNTPTASAVSCNNTFYCDEL